MLLCDVDNKGMMRSTNIEKEVIMRTGNNIMTMWRHYVI